MGRANFKVLTVIIFAMVFLSRSAAADQCVDLRDPEPKITACTESINSGKWKGHDQAISYNNRGIAYLNKNWYDRAIKDFDQAIKLDQSYADAFPRSLSKQFIKIPTSLIIKVRVRH